MSRPRTDARDLLLARVVEQLAHTGIAGLSLRELAASIGSSHRMLVYHFGSKAGLLAEVVRQVEAGQRAWFDTASGGDREGGDRDGGDRDGGDRDGDDRSAEPGAVPDTRARVRAMWQHWTDPATQRQERLFFEMVGMALQGDPAMQPLLDDLVVPWLAPVSALRRAVGVGPADADADARLAVAVTRGLLLDLLATGDVDATTAAFERFGDLLALAEPGGRAADDPAGEPADGSAQRGRKRSS